jgi:hypothetical protein
MRKSISRFKRLVDLNLSNLRNVNTKRKFVVFESDDWGAIRMPNRNVLERTINYGIKANTCPYMNFDTLACSDDFDALYNVLKSFKDINGNSPVITANSIMANPDFDKIEDSNFQEYFYEEFTTTIERYYPNQNVFQYWKDGLRENIFFPQLHGREHLFVSLWLKNLLNKSDETLFAFKNRYYGISTTVSNEKRSSYLPAFDYNSDNDLCFQREAVIDAQTIFLKHFGFTSESFIAPNYTWSSSLEDVLFENGINIIQGHRIQKIPQTNGIYKQKRHYTGEVNSKGQMFFTRNVEFEPSLSLNFDWNKNAIKQIENAFFWNSPAIISTHRLNFIGAIYPKNREGNLLKLRFLIKEILQRWPDVEFVTTPFLFSQLILKK